MENPARNARHATQPLLKKQRAKTTRAVVHNKPRFARDAHKLKDCIHAEKKKEGEPYRLPSPYLKTESLNLLSCE
jgi:hypothetical protein